MSDLFGYIGCLVLTAFFTWWFSEPRIYPESVEFAGKVCAVNGGWMYIEEGRTENASVKCVNGAEFAYKWTALGVDE